MDNKIKATATVRVRYHNSSLVAAMAKCNTKSDRKAESAFISVYRNLSVLRDWTCEQVNLFEGGSENKNETAGMWEVDPTARI